MQVAFAASYAVLCPLLGIFKLCKQQQQKQGTSQVLPETPGSRHSWKLLLPGFLQECQSWTDLPARLLLGCRGSLGVMDRSSSHSPKVSQSWPPPFQV